MEKKQSKIIIFFQLFIGVHFFQEGGFYGGVQATL